MGRVFGLSFKADLLGHGKQNMDGPWQAVIRQSAFKSALNDPHLQAFVWSLSMLNREWTYGQLDMLEDANICEARWVKALKFLCMNCEMLFLRARGASFHALRIRKQPCRDVCVEKNGYICQTLAWTCQAYVWGYFQSLSDLQGSEAIAIIWCYETMCDLLSQVPLKLRHHKLVR